MLRWTLIFFAISLVAGIFQFMQFTGVPVRAAEISIMLSAGFLIPFIAFLVFGLLALGSLKADHKNHPVIDGIRIFFGWR